MKIDLNQLFAAWETKESYSILFITVLAFLLGLLVALLLRAPRIRRLRKQLKAAEQSLTEARNELGLMKDKLDQKEADVQRLEFDLAEMTDKMNALDEDKAKLYQEVFSVNQDLEKQQASVRTYLTTIEDLNNQIVGLKTRQEQLLDTHEEHLVTINGLQQHIAELESQQADAGARGALPFAAPPEARDILGDTRSRLETFENKLSNLERENNTLRNELLALKVEKNTAAITGTTSPSLSFDLVDEEPEPEALLSPRKDVLREKIIVDGKEKDDLTRIVGIGPFLEKKLNDIGVLTYEQIAAWDPARIEQVTTDIEYFPGRIRKDDWVGQAAELMALKRTNPEAFLPRVKAPEDKGDLKIVEGIGPKIEQLLKEAGIQTWHDLAGAEVEQLQSILTAAGDRYRIHDPGTWPNQARMATEGRWEELDAYQQELKGGREVNE